MRWHVAVILTPANQRTASVNLRPSREKNEETMF
jgi:hypothetical protein